MRTPHLLPALIALGLLAAVVFAGDRYATWVEQQAAGSLAATSLAQTSHGGVLQQAAVARPDLLPIYGSSELLNLDDPYHAVYLFAAAPSGFRLFIVGRPGASVLNISEQLATIGAAVAEKMVVISLTPFTTSSYNGNFSRLHAYSLIFSTDLSRELKRDIALQMLTHPRTVRQDPLLRFALEHLADDSPASQVLSAALLPLGKLQIGVLRMQDHWETLHQLQRQRAAVPPSPGAPSSLDWPALTAQAEQDYRRRADSNPYGIANARWPKYRASALKTQSPAARRDFRALMTSSGWAELELLLRELRELGARPLILSAPLNGAYLDAHRVSAKDRQAFYSKLEALGRHYDVPVVDFADHDEDRYFAEDIKGHISSKGWVAYAQTLDAFYHDRLG